MDITKNQWRFALLILTIFFTAIYYVYIGQPIVDKPSSKWYDYVGAVTVSAIVGFFTGLLLLYFGAFIIYQITTSKSYRRNQIIKENRKIIDEAANRR